MRVCDHYNIIHCMLKGYSSMNVSFKPVISGLLHFRIVQNETKHMNCTLLWQGPLLVLKCIVVFMKVQDNIQDQNNKTRNFFASLC